MKRHELIQQINDTMLLLTELQARLEAMPEMPIYERSYRFGWNSADALRNIVVYQLETLAGLECAVPLYPEEAQFVLDVQNEINVLSSVRSCPIDSPDMILSSSLCYLGMPEGFEKDFKGSL